MDDPLTPFEGIWRLSRRIEDARAGETVTGTGTATATRDGAALIWHEEVTLVWPGRAPLTGTRGGRWEAQGAGFAAFFEDGRFFHAIDAVTGQPETHHDCPPDLYRVRYDFVDLASLDRVADKRGQTTISNVGCLSLLVAWPRFF